MFTAYAQTAAGAAPTGSLLMGYLPFIAVIGIFYFLIIRPQNTRAKAHAEMVSSLNKGDKVITSGGIHGEVVKTNEDMISLTIAENTVITVNATSISVRSELGKASQKAAKKAA
ncbi:MAG: preprotein translocase subunit YajC [Alphaproteobacteria bacterium]|nr:preprotein translocase subunit YajC [Alphaproteobacteria bacterium]